MAVESQEKIKPTPAYFRELQGYSLQEVATRLQCESDIASKFLKHLRQHGIVKIVRKEKKDYSNISNEDVLLVDDAEDAGGCYKFDFVGVIVLGIQESENKGVEKVIFSFPKYIKESSENKLSDFREDFKHVLRAIQEYGKKNQELVHLYNGSDKGSFNHLALALHILNDYYENGIYTNIEQVIETNGEGEIDWDRTINETFAYLKNNRPYYLELKTIATQNDEYDYFKRLHECVVTKCSDYLENLGLLDLFSLAPVQLTDSVIDDFGDKDYIKYRLEREISSQFVTKKQNLLKTLYTYVAEKQTEQELDNFSVYGTNSLNLVWEKACGRIFENHFENGVYNDGECRFEIEKPKWHFSKKTYETDTLIPDIVTRFSRNDDDIYGILDGKYYLVDENNNSLNGNPGIQDVVKQFVYHRAILRRIPGNQIFNSFLFPSIKKSSETRLDFINIRGCVTMMDWGIDELVPIYLAFLNPTQVWIDYVNGSSRKEELNEARNAIDPKMFFGM